MNPPQTDIHPTLPFLRKKCNWLLKKPGTQLVGFILHNTETGETTLIHYGHVLTKPFGETFTFSPK